ncbi:MAG TPA: large-conductance mechanosensitive channel protein MscL [Nitrospiria bacterium]|nr:large-conductance mechanosensitive channel protein MscL [Nitrospiria bacterium]
MVQEFKAFALRGNVVDMAVGIIIGAAFGKIINSLVEDVLMPPLGLAIGGVDFSGLFISLSGTSYPSLAAAQQAGAATLRYGIFLNTILNFAIVAIAMFMVIKAMNRLKGLAEHPAPAAPTTMACPECLSQIPLGARRCAHCGSVVAKAT